MYLLQNPARKPMGMGMPGSDLHDNVRPQQ